MHAARRPNPGNPKDAPVAPPQRVPSGHPRGPTEVPPKTKPEPKSARSAERDPKSARRPEPDPRAARRPEPDPTSARRPEPDPRAARRPEPDPKSARRPEPDPKSARRPEPDPTSARRPEPDPKSARRPEPDPRAARRPEPDPRAARRPEPDPTSARRPEPDPRAARRPEPDPKSARRPEPDPTSARRPEPDPKSARRPEPDPRAARRPEPDPTSARRPEPDPKSARRPEPDPRAARRPEPDPKSARRPEPDPRAARRPEPQPVPERKPEPVPERKAEPKPEPQHTAAPLLPSGPPPAPLSMSEAALAAERAVYERRLRDFFARHGLQRSDAEIAAAVAKAQRQLAGLRGLWRSLVERHGEAPARFALGTLEEMIYPASREVREIASGLIVRPALYNELSKFFADDNDGNCVNGRVLALQFTGMNTALYDAAPPDARAAFCRAIEVQLSVLADCSPSRFNVTWDCTGVAVVRILTGSNNNQVDSHGFTYRNHYPNYNDDDRSCEAIKAALVKSVRCGGGMLRIVRDSYRRDLSGGAGAMSIALAQVPSTATIIQSVPPAPRPSEPNGHTPYDGGRQRFAYNGESPASLLSSSPRQQAAVRMPSESVASIMASVHDAPLPLETQFVAPVCGVRKPSRPLVLPTESPSRSDWAATEWIERSYRGGF